MRPVLTHWRGDLRIEEERRQYALPPDEALLWFVIEVNQEVLSMLNELGAVVRCGPALRRDRDALHLEARTESVRLG